MGTPTQDQIDADRYRKLRFAIYYLGIVPAGLAKFIETTSGSTLKGLDDKVDSMRDFRAEANNSYAADIACSEKGAYLGKCDNPDCQEPPANWYNHCTKKYYCALCAGLMNVGSRDTAFTVFGHPLCTMGEHVPLSLIHKRRKQHELP